MTVEIRKDTSADLADYATVAATFTVTSRVEVSGHSAGAALAIHPVALPYVKDYDAVSGGGPLTWPERFQVDGWGLFSARTGKKCVGAVAVTTDPTLLEQALLEPAPAILFDIRVAPSHRGVGVGHALFAAAERWAQARGCRTILAETQDINVAACRFYEAQGFHLATVDPRAYPTLPDEVRLVWRKTIRATAGPLPVALATPTPIVRS
jgi:GNAT superfamily N-acetyltransferase